MIATLVASMAFMMTSTTYTVVYTPGQNSVLTLYAPAGEDFSDVTSTSQVLACYLPAGSSGPASDQWDVLSFTKANNDSQITLTLKPKFKTPPSSPYGGTIGNLSIVITPDEDSSFLYLANVLHFILIP